MTSVDIADPIQELGLWSIAQAARGNNDFTDDAETAGYCVGGIGLLSLKSCKSFLNGRSGWQRVPRAAVPIVRYSLRSQLWADGVSGFFRVIREIVVPSGR